MIGFMNIYEKKEKKYNANIGNINIWTKDTLEDLKLKLVKELDDRKKQHF